MDRLLKKVVMTVLGVALIVGVWTVRGWFEGEASGESLSQIPSTVWDGGGGKITIEAEATEPARISASFETDRPVDDAKHKYLETWQAVDAGSHSFSINVPANVGGNVEIGIENPKIGAKVRIAVRVDGQVVAEDSMTLEQPLKPGYGFFAQVHLEDYATGKLGED